MKYFGIYNFIIILICFTFLAVTSVSAQTEIDKDNLDSDLGETIYSVDRAFSILLTRDVQDPGNKQIQYRLHVLSNITTDRVELNWSVIGVSEILSEQRKNIKLAAGQVLEETFTVRPRNTLDLGLTRVSVEMKAYGASSDYIAAATDEFVTSTEQEILPLSNEYITAKNIANLKSWALIAAVMAVVMVLAYFAYNKFRDWLDRGKATAYLDY